MYPILIIFALIASVSYTIFDPFQFQIPCLSSIIAIISICLVSYPFILSGWESAEPNQWLLIIQDGRMVKAGVGLRTFRWFFQTVVMFSSQINKIPFAAMQVTQEMQGVEIKGFAIWSVDRTVENEGPFKYYKNMTGPNASENVKTMCESIVRHNISNTKLEKVLTDREAVKNVMKSELQAQLKGWGVWLETVEITDIRICSKTLFEDMQAQYRQEENLKAEKIRLSTQNQIDENKLQNDLKSAKNNDTLETDRVLYQNQQQLKRMQQDFQFYQKNLENRKKTLIMSKEMQTQVLQKEQELELAKTNQTVAIQKMQTRLRLDKLISQYQLEESMSETNFQKYIIDSTKLTCSSLPIKNIHIQNYVPPEKSGLSSFLPGIAQLSDFKKQQDSK